MNQGTPHIVLAGGGTAGHVNPLLAVAGAIRDIEPTAQVTVIGTAVGLEKDLVPEAGYELDTIEKVPFPRRPNLYMLRFRQMKRETAKVRSILETRHADVVAGFGGYASAPVYATAHKMGIPIAIHEQNARAGMANKLALVGPISSVPCTRAPVSTACRSRRRARRSAVAPGHRLPDQTHR